jgi:site-specific DNA-methyltransferase (adenine-specific)
MATATVPRRTRPKNDNISNRKVGATKRSKYQILPPPAPEYLASLRASIAQRGVDEAIIVDENGEIVDGVQRATICDELGIFCPTQVRLFTSESEKFELALTRNCTRRQLGREDKKKLISVYLRVDPQISDHLLAQIIGGISSNNVAAVRAKLISVGDIREFKKLRGKDGRYRPHKYSKVFANTPNELLLAQEAIHNLPPSCDGKHLDVTTAQRRAARAVRLAAAEDVSVSPTRSGDIRLFHCRFQDLEKTARLHSNSTDLVLTDIPYVREFLPQLDELAAFAERILVPGGLFITYAGQFYLPQIMNSLGRHLTYRWMIASVWQGDGNWVSAVNAVSTWTAILMFSKGPWRHSVRWPDVSQPTREKLYHEWQKPLEEVETFARYFSHPDSLVVDPCAGSFTTAVACKRLGRKFVGCDMDAKAVAAGQKRLTE